MAVSSAQVKNLGNKVNKQNPTASVSGYDASKVTLSDEDTIEGRVPGIIESDSPLMQQAVTRAKQAANAGRVLNSTMAITAGQSALYDAAVPIAAQDAQASLQTKLSNQNAENQAAQFGAGSINTAAGDVLAGNQALEQINTRGNIDLRLQSNEAAARMNELREKGRIDLDLQKQSLAAQRQLETELLEKRGEIDLMLQGADAVTRQRLLAQQGQIDRQMQTLRGEQAQAQQQIINDFEASQADIDRTFQATENQADRDFQEAENARAAANALMTQISGQNATLSDALAQIYASDMPHIYKSGLANQLIQTAQDNMNMTMSLANYSIESNPDTGEFEVIYGDPTFGQEPPPEIPADIADTIGGLDFGSVLYPNG